MINRFALCFLCIEFDRDNIFGVMLLYILFPFYQLYFKQFERIGTRVGPTPVIGAEKQVGNAHFTYCMAQID